MARTGQDTRCPGAEAYPDLLTPCYMGASPSGELGPLNPARNRTYEALWALLRELTTLFPDSYLHLGGDEVPFDCWEVCALPYLARLSSCVECRPAGGSFWLFRNSSAGTHQLMSCRAPAQRRVGNPWTVCLVLLLLCWLLSEAPRQGQEGLRVGLPAV